LKQVSKWAFYGVVFSIVGYYALPFSINFSFISFSTSITRNAFVFDLICGVPLSFLFIRYHFNKIWVFFILILLFVAFMYTNGRSAAIIGALELVFLLYIFSYKYRNVVKFSFLGLMVIFIFVQTDYAQIYIEQLASNLESVNPRFASLLKGEDEGDLEQDKSWLHRRLMIDKGKEIVKSYPFFGIGIGNFSYYDSPLKSYMTYSRLGAESISYYNSRSAHNSYVQVMSESGLVGLGLVLTLLIIPVYYLLKFFFTVRMDVTHLALISLLGMSMHFYAIAAIFGALPWLIVGLAWGSLQSGFKKSKIWS
jgi:O-antigen ligase